MNYKSHRQGKKSLMTLSRIHALESLGFERENSNGVPWEDCLSELADYSKLHGHCKVPYRDSENFKLGHWVFTQRRNYKLYLRGEKSHMTPLRIYPGIGKTGF
jgi:hypothetical protein